MDKTQNLPAARSSRFDSERRHHSESSTYSVRLITRVTRRVTPLALLLCLAAPAYAQRDLAEEARRTPGDPVTGQKGCTWQHRGGWVVDCGPVLTSAPPPIPPPAPGDAIDVARRGIYLPGWRYTQQDLNGGFRIVILSVTTGIDGRLIVLGQVYYSAVRGGPNDGDVLAFTPGSPNDPKVFVQGPWPAGTLLHDGWRLDQPVRGQ